ncbi:MAG: class II aldolase/adducin family protein [Bdellovibrionales bacterium]
MTEEKIIEICTRLYEKNFLVAQDGNVSVKEKDCIKITPSGVDKSSLKPHEICSIDFEGHPLKGKASSEKEMHLAIYKNQKKAGAVVHSHPPAAIALSLARPRWKKLPLSLPETVISLGEVPFIKYVQPGLKEMGESLIPYLEKSTAFILSHHGAVTWGENLEEAYQRMTTLEHSCKIIWMAESIGRARSLPKKELQKLWNRKD